MANGLLSKASSAVATCVRRVWRATRRLLRAAGEAEVEDDDGLWRREILMGERCKPLDFPGVIHYDSFGRRLSAPPVSRGGKAALLCRSTYDVDEDAIMAPRKAVTKRLASCSRR